MTTLHITMPFWFFIFMLSMIGGVLGYMAITAIIYFIKEIFL